MVANNSCKQSSDDFPSKKIGERRCIAKDQASRSSDQQPSFSLSQFMFGNEHSGYANSVLEKTVGYALPDQALSSIESVTSCCSLRSDSDRCKISDVSGINFLSMNLADISRKVNDSVFQS